MGAGHHRSRQAPTPLHGGTYVVTRGSGPFHKVGGAVPSTPRNRASDMPTSHRASFLSPRLSAGNGIGQRSTVYRPTNTALTRDIRYPTPHRARVRLHCNPVERTNKTIKIMIAQYVGRNHHWDQQIATLQFAYNTAWQPVIRRPILTTAASSTPSPSRRTPWLSRHQRQITAA